MKEIHIGSDHAGFTTKEKIKTILDSLNIKFVDEGTYSKDSCDYVFYAKEVAQKVLENNSKGILICGTGIGMSIAANRIKGIRAALVNNEKTAELSRSHNNSNILVLPSNLTKIKLQKIIKTWLSVKFNNVKRHKRRIEALEK